MLKHHIAALNRRPSIPSWPRPGRCSCRGSRLGPSGEHPGAADGTHVRHGKQVVPANCPPPRPSHCLPRKTGS